MELLPEICYQAILSHDRRFDGLFFTCVTSTHIYCRPICPAIVPRIEHCRFVRSAAQAERQGFRPCMRCRPERAPNVPLFAFSPAEALAAHIDATLMSDQTFGSISHTYGISERQLRRVFSRLYGVEPHEYLTTRRLLFAKQLLQDTSLPILQAAYAAGFGSPGRLTIQLRKAYGLTPQQLRKQTTKADTAQLQLKTDYRPPLDWHSMLEFLAKRATPDERIENGIYYRHIDKNVELSVQHLSQTTQVLVTIPAECAKDAYRYLRKVRKLFDLDAEPTAVATALRKDEFIGQLSNRFPGMRVPGCWDEFEMILRVIVGQQISVAGATTVMRRLVERIGATPAVIAASSPAYIASTGMPRKRAETIWQLGKLVESGGLDLLDMNPTTFYEKLVSLPGIGPWNAEYLTMRVLHWPDALPAADLGLQKALIPGQRVTEKFLTARMEIVRPWRSYAAVLLWKSLQNQGG